MTLEDLGNRYSRLRADLAHAYEAPVWDSRVIDGLTDAIAETESALAASGTPEAFSLPTARRGNASMSAASF